MKTLATRLAQYVIKPTGHPTFRISLKGYQEALEEAAKIQNPGEAYQYLLEQRERLYQQQEDLAAKRLTPLDEISLMLQRMSLDHKFSIISDDTVPLKFYPWMFDMDRSKFDPSDMSKVIAESVKTATANWLQIIDSAKELSIEERSSLKEILKTGINNPGSSSHEHFEEEKSEQYKNLSELQKKFLDELSQISDKSPILKSLKETIEANSFLGFKPQIRFSKEGVMEEDASEAKKIEVALEQISQLSRYGVEFGGVVLANCNEEVYKKFIETLKENKINPSRLWIIPLIEDEKDLESLKAIAPIHAENSKTAALTGMMAQSDSAVNNGVNRFAMSFSFATTLRELKEKYQFPVNIDFGTGSSGPRFGPIEYHVSKDVIEFFATMIHVSGASEFHRTLQGEELIFHSGDLILEINEKIEQKLTELRQKDPSAKDLIKRYSAFANCEEWNRFTQKAESDRKELIKNEGKFHQALEKIIDKENGVATLKNYGSRGQSHPDLEKFPDMRAIQLVEIYSQIGIYPELMTAFANIDGESKEFLVKEYESGNVIVQTMLENYWWIKEKFQENFDRNSQLLENDPDFRYFYKMNEEALRNLGFVLEKTVEKNEASIATNKHILHKIEAQRSGGVPHYRFSTTKTLEEDSKGLISSDPKTSPSTSVIEPNAQKMTSKVELVL